jgi:Ser/Thr protein kinase RdoA (MazF antagonist)
MTNAPLAPFSALTPDIIFKAFDTLGLSCDGRLLALNSYENRVYQVGMTDGDSLVVKFYRPGRWSDAAILEEHAFVQELYDDDLPVVPALAFADGKTLHHVDGFRFSVFPKQGGRVPELQGGETLAWMGRLLGRIHAAGVLKAFKERPRLDIHSFGELSRDYLLNHHCIPETFVAEYRAVSAECLAGVRDCFAQAGSIAQIRLHGDCYPGNLLWTDEGPHFVDFDDSRSGPAIQDLWMLLSGERAEMTGQLQSVLDGYRMFMDFNLRELHLLEALRTLRLIHYAAWIAKRWDDPAFPAAFPWFTSPQYWQNRITELRGQLESMAEPPLSVSLFEF